ncbi:EAL domain-containing protein [Mycobacterium decipiens]|uniref:EAL domain-containing protein n=1 Tax=Mycobacterium decipiens TaxID=1430326 RepID=A0A1X2LVX3_9MYCO|nr:EAL domain-containing protein [Mycobacterium decipiens]
MIDYYEILKAHMETDRDRWAGFDRGQQNTHDGLSTSMRAALDRGEFFLVYQPIIRLADNCIIGAEALLRWQHPTLGTLLPGQFIDRAEANGLIVPLTAFVIEQACRHVHRWRDDSTDLPPFVSVNVSASTICDPGFLPLVESVLAETGLPAHALQLELAEDARLTRDEKSVTRLQELSALGVGIAIDDFGIGFSSLAYLPSLPVDVVKLAGKFIESLDGNIQARLANEQITRAMIDLADKLGITVTAKLVETPSQAARLRAFGCEAAQGWHFARALPVSFFKE